MSLGLLVPTYAGCTVLGCEKAEVHLTGFNRLSTLDGAAEEDDKEDATVCKVIPNSVLVLMVSMRIRYRMSPPGMACNLLTGSTCPLITTKTTSP
jgi:hypothetical protein